MMQNVASYPIPAEKCMRAMNFGPHALFQSAQIDGLCNRPYL